MQRFETCHFSLTVEGRPACTYISLRPGQKPYKILRSKKPCRHCPVYWPIAQRGPGGVILKKGQDNTKTKRATEVHR